MLPARRLKQQYVDMINKTYVYGGKIHYIKDIKVYEAENSFTVITNLQPFVKPLENIDHFLSQFKEKSSDLAIVPMEKTDAELQFQELMTASFKREEEQAVALETELAEALEKVKANPAYLKQAMVVNNIVNARINLAKVKLAVRAQHLRATGQKLLK